MPKVPFQRLTLVRLVSAPNPPPDSPKDDAIQAAHIQYLGGLVASGTILANGPVRRMDDPKWRGFSLYSVDAEMARQLANQDPAVKAGWFDILVDEWLIRAEPKVIGDRIDLELDVPS